MNQQPAHSPTRPAQAGFTLVEIMVVVVIIGLLATMVAANVIGASDDARLTKAQADIASIAGGVKLYYTKNGKLPPSLEALVEPDDKGRSYIEQLGNDPWGHEYRLIEGDTPREWEVVSMGPDEMEGTEDDLSSKMKKDK